MANVLECLTETDARVASKGFCGTQDDFLEVLASLGAKVGPLYSALSVRKNARRAYLVFLSYDRREWIRELGEPQEISQHYDLLTHFPFQAWQQPCLDGSITCVGHLFERAPGRPWVTIARVIRAEA